MIMSIVNAGLEEYRNAFFVLNSSLIALVRKPFR